jgi:hypothetical protein
MAPEEPAVMLRVFTLSNPELYVLLAIVVIIANILIPIKSFQDF